jgi:hypothetical protein
MAPGNYWPGVADRVGQVGAALVAALLRALQLRG